jgi:hypothetical protein
MTNTTKTATRKIGQNRGKPRLWIEGKLLVEAGLDHGNHWDLVPINGGFLIQRSDDGKRKIAGKPGRPIVDIVGATLGDLGKAEHVTLTYRPGWGLIVVAEQAEPLIVEAHGLCA